MNFQLLTSLFLYDTITSYVTLQVFYSSLGFYIAPHTPSLGAGLLII